jgi:hypothetical protein
LSSLTSALAEEFAGNVFGVCAAQDESVVKRNYEGKPILLEAVLGGLIARSNCCEPTITPFGRAWPFGNGAGIGATPTAVSPLAPNEFRPL